MSAIQMPATGAARRSPRRVQPRVVGRFAPAAWVPPRIIVATIAGGLLLGYGSRIAYGCNIAAYFRAIASTSLHGWLWGAAALLGTPIGVRLRNVLGLDQRQTSAPSC